MPWIELVERESGKLILTTLKNIATIMESESPDPVTGQRHDGGPQATIWLKKGYQSGKAINVKEDYLTLRVMVKESLVDSILTAAIMRQPPK